MVDYIVDNIDDFSKNGNSPLNSKKNKNVKSIFGTSQKKKVISSNLYPSSLMGLLKGKLKK